MPKFSFTVRATAALAVCGLVISAQTASAAKFVQNPGAGVLETNTLSIGAGNLLDMTNNPLIVQSTAYATVYGYYLAGYNGFGFDGTTGITSATAAADAGNFSLMYGVIDNADPFASYATFFGRPVNPGAALGRLTYIGDVNLDGAVDSSDYFFLDINFGGPANGRMSGDVNADNVLDSSDYFYIDVTFGSPTLPAPLAGGPDKGVVPEPTSAALLGLGVLGLLARRRR